jgi:hypothetical protein
MSSLIKKLDSLIEKLASSRVFKSDFDYHLVRGSMVFVFLMFGYQKWFESLGEAWQASQGREPIG